MPAGLTAAGLPVGVQVVGAFDHDVALLEIVERLGDVLGGWQPPPFAGGPR